jgi:uroporphyrinogen decarboxylase
MTIESPPNSIPPLTRAEVVSVIEGHSTARRVPVQIHLWVHPKEFGDREDTVRRILATYPADMQIVPFHMPDVFKAPDADPGHRWVPFDAPHDGGSVGIDQRVAIADWARLNDVLIRFPDPQYPALFRNVPADDGRYRLGHWWFCLFERHWSLRGMSNALMDFYTNPREVHQLYRALTDFYMAAMERGRREHGMDGIFTSDDIGMQTGPFFSPKIFRTFFKPYYKELIAKAHELGMHFFLHTCGNIEPFIPEFIEIGLDVLHPIQKHTMDERIIAEKYGGKLTIWAGLDVQQVIPWGTPDEVRAEVRHLMDTFWRRGEGRMLLTAGNGINGDCTLESLEAFFDEAVSYGMKFGAPQE